MSLAASAAGQVNPLTEVCSGSGLLSSQKQRCMHYRHWPRICLTPFMKQNCCLKMSDTSKHLTTQLFNFATKGLQQSCKFFLNLLLQLLQSGYDFWLHERCCLLQHAARCMLCLISNQYSVNHHQQLRWRPAGIDRHCHKLQRSLVPALCILAGTLTVETMARTTYSLGSSLAWPEA